MGMLLAPLGALGGAAGGAGGILGAVGSLVGAVAPLLGAGGGESQSAPPAPPAAPPPAPPTVSTAADVSEEPIVDTEAARVRAQKRRAQAEEESEILGLSEKSKTAVNLTTDLLGG